MEKRQYDMFFDMANNPGASFDNLVAAGLTANNTALQERDYYKNNQSVRDKFKNQYGEFDEARFDASYNNAKLYYNNLANADYAKSIERQVSYHRDNVFAPIEQRRSGPDFIEIKSANPYQITSSIFGLGKEGERTRSIDELAQTQRVLLNPTTAGDNLENAKWGDAPNDNFWGYFLDTLVIAQYDSDGTHIDQTTGKKVSHKKGDLKLDNDGNFFYEKLDGRNVYGRSVLNKMNVLTTDGSWANKFDFFDSDDLHQKDVASTTLKNLALVGTMFLPGIGPWVAGLSIATQLTGLMGTLGKMIVGSDSPVFSEMEGWAKSVNRQTAKSEYAQQNTWCWENFINLIGDVAGQLKEQRFMFEKVPAVFKGAPVTKANEELKLKQLIEKQQLINKTKIAELEKAGLSSADIAKASSELNNVKVLSAIANGELESFVKGYQRMGEIFGKGYMTAITVGDTFGEAKEAGATDLEATMLTIGYAAGEYAILNTGIGEWIYPELREKGFRYNAIAKGLADLTEKNENLWKQFGRALTNAPKDAKRQWTKDLFNLGKSIAKSEYVNGTRGVKATLAAGVGEAIEEVSEELLYDFSKGCYDVVQWLRGNDSRMTSFGISWDEDRKMHWDGKEIVDRYGMSAVGGFVGGALTNAGTTYNMLKDYQNNPMTNETARQQLVYMTRNGEIDDFLKYVNKHQIGDVNKSFDYEIIDGQVVFNPGTAENNQDTQIKQLINRDVELIKNILAANGAKPDSHVLNAQIMGDLRYAALQKSTTAGGFIQEYNNLCSTILNKTEEINGKLNSVKDTNNDGKISDGENKASGKTTDWKELMKKLPDAEKAYVEQAIEELDQAKQKLDDLNNGKLAWEFIADAMFEMTSALSGRYITTTLPLFAEHKYQKKYSELTKDQIESARKEYEVWKSTEGRNKIRAVSEVFRQIVEQTSGIMQKDYDAYVNGNKFLYDLQNQISTLYEQLISADNLKKIADVPTRDSEFLEGANLIEQGLPGKLALDIIEKFIEPGKLTTFKQLHDDLIALNNDENADITELQNKEQLYNQERNKLLQEVFTTKIPELVQPFIDNGFINQEFKSKLNQLLDWAINGANEMFQEFELQNSGLGGLGAAVDIENPYLDVVHELHKLQEEIKKLDATPFEKSINNFAVQAGLNPINFTELVETVNSILTDTSGAVENFSLDSTLSEELDNALLLLDMYEGAIYAARTDNIGVNNILGYNATLNEIADKMDGEETHPKLFTMDSTNADLFLQDINIHKNKLLYLKRLNEINRGQKLNIQNRVSVNKNILTYKRMRNIIDDLRDDDPLKKWEGLDELIGVVDAMEIHSRLANTNSISVKVDEEEAFESEKINLENAINTFWNLNEANILANPEMLEDLVSPERLQLFTNAPDLLTDKLQSLDDNSFLWWFAARAAVNSADVYGNYKEVIRTTGDNILAPIPTQEAAIYTNYANIANGNVFDLFLNAYKNSVKKYWKGLDISEREAILEQLGIEEPEFAQDKYAEYCLNFLPTPRYSHISLTEGIPGAGKSTGVFKPTLDLIRKFHNDEFFGNGKKVWVVHGAENSTVRTSTDEKSSAEKLQESLDLDNNNSEIFDRQGIMKRIDNTWTDYAHDAEGKLIINKNDYTLDKSDNTFKSNRHPTATTDIPSLIIIDEVSKFNTYDLDEIEEFAAMHGIAVMAAGDFDQSGLVGSHGIEGTNSELDGLNWSTELSRTLFPRTFKLGISMRTSGSLKSLNIASMQAYMQDPNGKLDLKHYWEGNELYGDEVLLYESSRNGGLGIQSLMDDGSIMERVQKLIDSANGEKIGYIYHDVNSALYKELSKDKYKPFIELKEGGSAQGLESKYYIVEANETIAQTVPDKTARKQYLRDLYTGISRAKQGSLAILPLEFRQMEITSTLNNQNINEPLDPDIILKFATKRKELLGRITPGSGNIQIKPRTIINNSQGSNNNGNGNSNQAPITQNSRLLGMNSQSGNTNRPNGPNNNGPNGNPNNPNGGPSNNPNNPNNPNSPDNNLDPEDNPISTKLLEDSIDMEDDIDMFIDEELSLPYHPSRRERLPYYPSKTKPEGPERPVERNKKTRKSYAERFDDLVSNGILDNILFMQSQDAVECVVANINGVKVGFAKLLSGWTPVFGVVPSIDGRIIEPIYSNDDPVINARTGYGIPEIQRVQQLLDEQLTWKDLEYFASRSKFDLNGNHVHFKSADKITLDEFNKLVGFNPNANLEESEIIAKGLEKIRTGGTEPPNTSRTIDINLDSYPFKVGDLIDIYGNKGRGKYQQTVTIIGAVQTKRGNKIIKFRLASGATANVNFDDFVSLYNVKYKPASKPEDPGLFGPTQDYLRDDVQALGSDLRRRVGLDTELARKTIHDMASKTIGSLELDNLPRTASRIDAHGLSKGDEIERLIALLKYGIRKEKEFYTAPLTNPDTDNASGLGPTNGTASGTAYRDGLFIVCGPKTDTKDMPASIKEAGIRTVLINTFDPNDSRGTILAQKLKVELSKLFPEVDFILYTEAADYYNSTESERPKRDDVRQPEKDYYKDNIAPSIDTVLTEKEKKERLLGSNEDNHLKSKVTKRQSAPYKIDMLMHSFNSFELGVKIDENGNITPYGNQKWMDERIDSINGLIKIDKILGRQHTAAQYIDMIGQIRKIIFNTENKAELIREVSEVLEISDLYCTFALKSSPRPSDDNIDSNRQFVSSDPNPLDKSYEEQSIYNGSRDLRSQETNRKQLVAIFGNNKYKNLLEIPILIPSSPFTLLKTKGLRGEFVFKPMLDRYKTLRSQNKGLYEIAKTLISEFEDNIHYKEIVDLFKLYTFSDGAVWVIKDKQWTVAKDLQNLGPYAVTSRGYYQEAPGLFMNDDTNPMDIWTTVEDFAKGRIQDVPFTKGFDQNPQLYVTKRVMLATSEFVDQIPNKKIVQPGHPFIIISSDPEYTSDKQIVDRFIAEQADGSLPKKTKLMYVLPPRVTIKEYADNLAKIISKQPGIQPIGTITTSYELLKALLNSDTFKTRLSKKQKNALAFLQRVIPELDRAKKISKEELKRKLFEKDSYPSLGINKKQSLTRTLDKIFVDFIYNNSSLNKTFSLNPNDLKIVEDALRPLGLDGVYYHAILVRGTQRSNEIPFSYPIQDDTEGSYSINGKKYMIHGKVDSPTFIGHIGALLDAAFTPVEEGGLLVKRKYNGNIHYASDDTYKYYYDFKTGQRGIQNANLDRSFLNQGRNRNQNTTQLKIDNLINYARGKVGIDLKPYFEGKSIKQGINDAVKDINSKNLGVIAFGINEELFITDKHQDILGQVIIYDNNNNPVRDISNLSDNNGNYSFMVRYKQSNGQVIKADATYKNRVLTLEYESNSRPIPELGVNEQNYTDYFNAGKNVLSGYNLRIDPSLRKVFESTSYQEFVQNFNNIVYVKNPRFRVDKLRALTPQNALEERVIQDIIAMNEFKNPEPETCTWDIKLNV